MGHKTKRKVRKAGDELLYVSPIMLCVAALVGWCLTDKLAGSQAGFEFFRLSILITIPIIAFQWWFYARSRDRLVYRILFLSMLAPTLVWYLMSLLWPVLWIPTMGINVKILLISLAALLFCCNGVKGFCYLRSRSKQINSFVEENYDRHTGALDWDKVLRSLRMSINIYVPGVPERVVQLGSLVMVISMMAGLNLRKIFPVFSAFAWGIPCIFVSSFFVQLMSGSLAQVLKVVELEKEMGLKIRPKM
jgi:hypothetical protein